MHFFIFVLRFLMAAIVWNKTRAQAHFKGTLNALLDALNNVRFATIREETKTKRIESLIKEKGTIHYRALLISIIHR